MTYRSVIICANPQGTGLPQIAGVSRLDSEGTFFQSLQHASPFSTRLSMLSTYRPYKYNQAPLNAQSNIYCLMHISGIVSSREVQ
jgi:hypothetical protein